MEWAQVLAIVIPIVFTIVVGIFYNNRQISLTNTRIDDLRADIREFKADTDRRFTEVHDELKEMKADIREIRQFLMRLIPSPEPPKENPR